MLDGMADRMENKTQEGKASLERSYKHLERSAPPLRMDPKESLPERRRTLLIFFHNMAGVAKFLDEEMEDTAGERRSLGSGPGCNRNEGRNPQVATYQTSPDVWRPFYSGHLRLYNVVCNSSGTYPS